MIPVFDQKLWQDCQLRATGANIHKVNNKATIYSGQFDLVKHQGKSWSDPMPSGVSRAEYTLEAERELRKLLT